MSEKKENSDKNTPSETDSSVEVKVDSQSESTEKSIEDKLAEMNDKYVRLYADFENFKKRTSKERVDLIRFAGEEMLRSFLPVLDDFERAMKAMGDGKENAELKKGVELIYHKFKKNLEDRGVKEMNAAGTEFNPDLHEAVANIPAPKEEHKGKVIEETERGYYLNDKVLRYAKVVVGQ